MSADAWQWLLLGFVVVGLIAACLDVSAAPKGKDVDEKIDAALTKFRGDSAVTDGRTAYWNANSASSAAKMAHGRIDEQAELIAALQLEIKVLKGVPLPDPEPPMVAPNFIAEWGGGS